MNKRPFHLFLLIGFLQGFPFFLAYHLTNFVSILKTFGGLATTAFFLFYAGFVVLLAYDKKYTLRLTIFSIVVGFCLAVLIQWLPLHMPSAIYWRPLFLTITGSYAAICLLQSYHQNNYCKPDYPLLFLNVWSNFCILILSCVFFALVFAVFVLWANLFSFIGIDAFKKLFLTPAFYMILSPVFFCIGMYASMSRQKILFSLRMIFLSFFRILLPILALIAWIYMLVLTYQIIFGNGPHHNYDGLSVAYQCLIFVVVSIVFVNAVYQDGGVKTQYSRGYRFVLTALIVLLPIMVLAGLALLVQNYPAPLLNKRSISLFVIAILLFAYTIVYFCGVFQRGNWLAALKRGNFVLSWCLILAMIVLNIPFLYKHLPKAPKLKSNAPTEIKQKIQQQKSRLHVYKLLLHRSGLRWVSANKVKKPFIMGYRNNRPLVACLVEKKHKRFFGQIENKQCIYHLGKGLGGSSHFKLLTGKFRSLQWVRNEYPAMTVRWLVQENPADEYTGVFCRAIYKNKIYTGLTILPTHWQGGVRPRPCQLVTGKGIRTVKLSQALSIKRG